MLVIGLTGGIGSGKSSACEVFNELGIDVVDTDQIAHELTQAGGAAVAEIQNGFGDTYITSEGALDRKKMRELVFGDSSQRAKLEALLHPLILSETINKIHDCRSPYVIVAIPLLFETGDYDHLIQRVLVIDCETYLQIERTIVRSQLNVQDVKAIMASQIDRQQRLTRADDIIVNNRDLDHLRTQITQLHRKYLSFSAQKTLDKK